MLNVTVSKGYTQIVLFFAASEQAAKRFHEHFERGKRAGSLSNYCFSHCFKVLSMGTTKN